ncbi:glycosyl hydrolase [Cellvibrio zantedeschiae]|uniref:Glycosyl hydrolase n=1 Tax=Cellvibrio zantedeschiae TaxID=1237077 RepID=A0ABQ3AVN6_9GAMM|nr:glycoside hydrolase family 3 C-terminal domain-containing protein [Cellvibrio zantedeschiae]GGY67537.1 glycosyl hydrolase [Cellvibrio zantedeschiae]
MGFQKKISVLAMAVAIASTASSYAAEAPKAWMNKKLAPEQRADLVLKQMTMDEKLKLVFGYFGTDAPWKNFKRPVESYAQSAGFVYGIPRLGIPHLWEADAGVGVASQGGPNVREATALPSGIATAATWNLKTAYAGGAMIGSESRAFGFNVQLAGGVNIMREPRNGRNFEYAGEDPLLGGKIVGAQIAGIQSNHVVSTLKHYALNNQETNRFSLDAKIDDASARMSDLLALQIAKEEGNPGSVMCSYNRVNGVYACESNYLLNEVLKQDWGFKGWVMSDWGATHSTVPAANNGLDQQSGIPFDVSEYYGAALKEAVQNGWVTEARLDDMVRRVLHPMFEFGLVDNPASPNVKSINFKANGLVSQKDAEESIVLLKNDSKLLPLNKSLKKIAIIGSHADVGVLSGGGSSQVYPVGGAAFRGGPQFFPGPMLFYPSSPLKAIQARAPEAKVSYNDGTDLAAAAKLAADADVVLVFANQWTAESVDVPNLSLPDAQDDLVAAVAKANAKTVVVLQTGGPVTMPWLANVGSVLEAWYPGTNGGEAIGRVLFGEVNPSGHLPATFPASESQLPRPVLDGYPEVKDARITVNYSEGAAVGYKWFDLKGHKPLFPFGFGLSYSEFSLGDLKAEVKNGLVNASFSVKNTGAVAGKEVAQVYVAPVSAKWESPKRLGGFQKVDLKPGASTKASVTVDPRLLGMYDSASKTWKIAEGDYKVILASDATDAKATSVTVHLAATTVDMHGKLVK